MGNFWQFFPNERRGEYVDVSEWNFGVVQYAHGFSRKTAFWLGRYAFHVQNNGVIGELLLNFFFGSHYWVSRCYENRLESKPGSQFILF
jgi:hypothetical protein